MEVSELLGLSRKALERAIEAGKIPGGTVAHGRRMFTLGKIHIIKGRLGASGATRKPARRRWSRS